VRLYNGMKNSKNNPTAKNRKKPKNPTKSTFAGHGKNKLAFFMKEQNY